jgi:peroxiredoxin
MKSIILLFLLSTSTLFSQSEMYEICPIKNSEKTPSSIVYETNGDSIKLNDYIGDKPTVIVFYRGGWCPYCTKHLAELNTIKSKIDSLGFQLIAITPDNFTNLDSSVVRSSEGIDYTLLSDKYASAMTDFGIGWHVNDKLYKKYKTKYNLDTEWWSGAKHHILPVPAVFVIKDGVIQYQHVDPNYSKRLSSEIILSFLVALQTE